MPSPDLPKGELELIRRLRDELDIGRPSDQNDAAGQSPIVGFGDDMAALEPDGPSLLWTTDMLMDGTDFESSRHSWREIGRKAMAVNLSDCAAMAVVPVSALCAVSLANELSLDDALDLIRGARDCGLQYRCPLVGGDTNSWDHPTVISISVAARPDSQGAPVRRDGARPGDLIFVSGPVGGSILGRHLTFEPRIETALAVNRAVRPRAMIDISDGLAIDLSRILEASGCGAELDEAQLEAVIHADAERLSRQDSVSPRDHALHDGEDFELIVVLPPDTRESACRALGLLPLGRISAKGLRLRHADGRFSEIEPRGWEHFQ